MSTLELKPEGWDKKVTKFQKQNINNYINSNETLQGIVNRCDDKYNLYINLEKDITGIIPREEIEWINIDENGLPKTNLSTGKVHKFVQFKIKEIKDENMLILSRKQVQKENLNWIKDNLQIGEKVKGIVKSIKPYGAFVEIGGGIVGLIYIKDLSVARIKTPFERLKIGQNIEVVVKSIDKEENKIILSYKDALGTWEENIKDFYQGIQTKGIIREIEKNKNGIFVELAPNLVGMAEYTEDFKYGELVDVYIKRIDINKKKIKLSIIK